MTLVVELGGVLHAPVTIVHIGEVVRLTADLHVHRVIGMQIGRQVVEGHIQRLRCFDSHSEPLSLGNIVATILQ